MLLSIRWRLRFVSIYNLESIFKRKPCRKKPARFIICKILDTKLKFLLMLIPCSGFMFLSFLFIYTFTRLCFHMFINLRNSDFPNTNSPYETIKHAACIDMRFIRVHCVLWSLVKTSGFLMRRFSSRPVPSRTGNVG